LWDNPQVPDDGFLFEPSTYGADVEAILALVDHGRRLLPLVMEGNAIEPGREKLRGVSASRLFVGAHAPEAAMSGLYVYLSCFDEAHTTAQDIPTAEGSYWHAIVHRQEPDGGNASYWFRQVGAHPIYPALARAADGASHWDPFAFIEQCETARRNPGSELERRARALQRLEWQLLFDYCARAR
jgi:hypothetical protein